MLLGLVAGCGSGDPAKVQPQAAAAARFAVVDKIKGPDGGYDYASVDAETNRLFVGREYGVMAVGLGDGKVIDRLVEANDVSAVLPISGGLMLSTIYGDDKVLLFERQSGRRVALLPAGQSPDAAAFDEASGLAFVMNAKSADITVIDVARRQSVDTIFVGGKPEAGVADGRGRLFVNVEDSAEIAVIDIRSRTLIGRYKLAGCVEPTGIAFDPTTGLLISACHNSVAKLVDSRSGEDRGSVPIGAEADGVIFDPRSRLTFVPAMDGNLTIFRLDEAGNAGQAQRLVTEPGARTAALDPRTSRLYLPTSAFRGAADGEQTQVPGSFKILVVAKQ